MDVYQINLAGLLSLCAALAYAQRKPAHRKAKGSNGGTGNPEASQWPFLVVYSLVMGADWLQVSILYTVCPLSFVVKPLTPSPGTVPLLPIPRRTRHQLKSRINPLHHRLPRRRPERLLHRLRGRQARSQSSMPVLLRGLLGLVPAHNGPQRAAAIPRPRSGRA